MTKKAKNYVTWDQRFFDPNALKRPIGINCTTMTKKRYRRDQRMFGMVEHFKFFFKFQIFLTGIENFFQRPRPGIVSNKPRNKCKELSNSMAKRENKRNQQKYGSFPKGCPGAVWPNGKPSKKYCRGNGMDKWGNPKLLWHNTCCIWKGSKCRHNPKYRYKKNVINVIRRWGKRMKRPRNSIKILGEKFLSWK